MLYLCVFSYKWVMIQSMTGFGRHEVSVDGNTVIAEIRSLNGKLADVRVKTSLQLGQHEIELRKLILGKAVRGKIDLVIEVKGTGLPDAGIANAELIKSYYTTLNDIAKELGVEDKNLYSTILRMPNVFQSGNGDIDASLSSALFEAVNGALDQFKEFRMREGASLHDDLQRSVQIIRQLLKEVAPFEDERTASLKDRLSQKIGEIERESLDANRFEQEILYYMDKLDIHEEKVRLEQHCQYFLEILAADGEVKGKKLNFISQEIGREINTLGAKAQWSAIQRIVVQMKDHLEKIKEQLANAL